MNPTGNNFDDGAEALNKPASVVGRGKTQVLQARTLPRVRANFLQSGVASGLSPPRGAACLGRACLSLRYPGGG